MGVDSSRTMYVGVNQNKLQSVQLYGKEELNISSFSNIISLLVWSFGVVSSQRKIYNINSLILLLLLMYHRRYFIPYGISPGMFGHQNVQSINSMVAGDKPLIDIKEFVLLQQFSTIQKYILSCDCTVTVYSPFYLI